MCNSCKEEFLRDTSDHPAADLLYLLPHTKEYKLLCLLKEVLEESFNNGYEAGVEDTFINLKNFMSPKQDI